MIVREIRRIVQVVAADWPTTLRVCLVLLTVGASGAVFVTLLGLLAVRTAR